MAVAPLDGGSTGCHPPPEDLGRHRPLMGFGGLCRWAQRALSMGLDFFFILLTKAGILTALENVQFTVTFHLRHFGCPPRLIQNACLR